MYEYKFVKIQAVFLTKHPKDEYQEVIIKHAKKGWRFVQVFAPIISGEEPAKFFDLIFERKVEAS